MPEGTLLAFADHGTVGSLLPARGGDAEKVLAEIGAAGVDIDDLGRRLREDGAAAFVRSWEQPLACIAAKTATTIPAR